ncbi:hypothetical protein JW935_21975 [candidate division KSB1 bacterium]|nr:hypothetical protein [candidate division KSB1 bacterium]
MAKIKNFSQRKEKIRNMSFTFLMLSLYFFYLLLRINPKLIYQSQQPVFFFDKSFIGDFFSYPGGINDLLSDFLSQFFYHGWTGALLLTLLFWLISWNTKSFIQAKNENRPVFYLPWIPSVLLLGLHSDYRFPLVFTTGLLLTLLSVNIYIRLAPSKSVLRFLFYILLYTVLFYLSAGQALVFSIIIIIYDALYFRRIIILLLYVLFAALLPWLAASTMFIVHVKDVYSLHLTSFAEYKVNWVSLVLYSFFPFILLFFRLEKYVKIKIKNTNSLFTRLWYGTSTGKRILQGIILLLVAGMMAMYSFDKKNEKAFLRIDCYARFREWDKLLDAAVKYKPNLYHVQYQINRALYHSGRLLDEMFSFPQPVGIDGIFMPHDMHGLYPLQHSDVFFDLGLVNETEHWAYEAVSISGDTPWNLQQLALVNILKEQRSIAARFLGLLRKTMWHKSWAMEYFKCLSDSPDFKPAELEYKKSIMPESDFLIPPNEPQQCLSYLLQNRNNKMAFEYFMAYCLLSGDLDEIIKNIHLLNNFNYPQIPRHLEEVILVYIQLTGRKDIPLPGRQISPKTVQRFIEFNNILKKYNRNKKAAYNELKKYNNTYWFYAFYYYKPMGQ